MRKIPSPADVAAHRQATVEREQERERVKTVRKRRRLRNGARLTSHVSDETAVALAKFVHPDLGGEADE